MNTEGVPGTMLSAISKSANFSGNSLEKRMAVANGI